MTIIFEVNKGHCPQSGIRSTAPAVVSTTPSAIPPTTGTKPTTSPASLIGTVTTFVAMQPVRKSSNIKVNKIMITRIEPPPVTCLIRPRFNNLTEPCRFQLYLAVRLGQKRWTSYLSSHCLSSQYLADSVVSYNPCFIRKGHQGSSPGGHSFVFPNVSINNKPIFFSEVVTCKNCYFLYIIAYYDLSMM